MGFGRVASAPGSRLIFNTSSGNHSGTATILAVNYSRRIG